MPDERSVALRKRLQRMARRFSDFAGGCEVHTSCPDPAVWETGSYQLQTEAGGLMFDAIGIGAIDGQLAALPPDIMQSIGLTFKTTARNTDNSCASVHLFEVVVDALNLGADPELDAFAARAESIEDEDSEETARFRWLSFANQHRQWGEAMMQLADLLAPPDSRGSPVAGVEVETASIGDPADATTSEVLSKEAKAMAAFIDNPDWPDERIAEAAGCHVKSLHRMQMFQRCKAARKEERRAFPRGNKDGKTGDVEAWDTPDDRG